MKYRFLALAAALLLLCPSCSAGTANSGQTESAAPVQPFSRELPFTRITFIITLLLLFLFINTVSFISCVLIFPHICIIIKLKP